MELIKGILASYMISNTTNIKRRGNPLGSLLYSSAFGAGPSSPYQQVIECACSYNRYTCISDEHAGGLTLLAAASSASKVR